jgi:hypothetical protein
VPTYHNMLAQRLVSLQHNESKSGCAQPSNVFQGLLGPSRCQIRQPSSRPCRCILSPPCVQVRRTLAAGHARRTRALLHPHTLSSCGLARSCVPVAPVVQSFIREVLTKAGVNVGTTWEGAHGRSNGPESVATSHAMFDGVCSHASFSFTPVPLQELLRHACAMHLYPPPVPCSPTLADAITRRPLSPGHHWSNH